RSDREAPAGSGGREVRVASGARGAPATGREDPASFRRRPEVALAVLQGRARFRPARAERQAVPRGRARSPPGRTPPVLAPRTRPALRPATAEGIGAGEEAAVHRRRGRLPRLRPMEGWEVAPSRGPPA